MANNQGTSIAINAYDAWGIPNPTNQGRFQYTRQAWLPKLGLYHYKARLYSPTLGRFLQTDPVGYEDQVNLYAYVGNDPVNMVDPTGMTACPDVDGTVKRADCPDTSEDIVVTGVRQQHKLQSTALAMSRPSLTASSGQEWQNERPQNEQPSKLETAKQCVSDQLGLDDLAAAGAAFSGFNILETRGKFAGATPGTSIASRGASAVFGQSRLPFQVPTIVGNPLTLSAGIRATSSFARIVGRGIPVVGSGLLAYDAAKIAQCVASDD